MLNLLVLKCIFTIYKIIFKMLRITALYFHLLSTLYRIQHTLLYCLITTFVAFRLYTYHKYVSTLSTFIMHVGIKQNSS